MFGGRGWRRSGIAITAALFAFVSTAGTASAAPGVTRISHDPFSDAQAQHATQVEPDTFAYGKTIVAVVQSGRVFGGGSSDIGWATSKDGGTTWTHGFMPGVTPNKGGGQYAQTSDPSIAYDPVTDTWISSTLSINGPGGTAVLVNRSHDGGLTWDKPVTVTTGVSLDKDWIVCDTWAASPFEGHCYDEWDNVAAGDRMMMSTSTDGGKTWSAPKAAADSSSGVGGQPVVQPSGTVVVPFFSDSGRIAAFRSTDGGASWTSTSTIAVASDHEAAGNLRTEPLPSATVDGGGHVYVAWQDCSFRTSCGANDIVLSQSVNGTSWSAVTRVPIDAVTSTVDHFIPGIDADPTKQGKHAHLALVYYYYPKAACSAANCALEIGFVSSTDGGATWSAPTQLAGPMTLSWLPNTSLGRMVGDYTSTSFVNGKAFPALVIAAQPKVGTDCQAAPTSCLESLFTTKAGLPAVGGGAVADVLPAATRRIPPDRVPSTLLMR